VVICDVIIYVVKVLLESVVSVFHLYEAVGSCETFIPMYQIKLCHNTEDQKLKVYFNRNFIFEILSVQYKTRFFIQLEFLKVYIGLVWFYGINYKCPLNSFSLNGS
jgi:hypothetical protein